MTVVASYVNYSFGRYQMGYLKDAEVVSQLLNTKVAKECLVALIEKITAIPHWQETAKLKNLQSFAKASLKNNFAGATVKKTCLASTWLSKQKVIDQGLNTLTSDLWGVIANQLPNVQPLFRFASSCKEAYFLRDEMLARSTNQLSRYLSELLAKQDEKRLMQFLGNLSQSAYAKTPLTLTLTTCWPRQAICLHEIQKKFTNFACLQIAKRDIVDDDFCQLLEACPKVKGLDLSNCSTLTAACLANAKYSLSLERLILSGTQLDDQGLQAICKNLKKLKELDISGTQTTAEVSLTVELPRTIEQYKANHELQQPALKRLLEQHPKSPCLLAGSVIWHLITKDEFSCVIEQLREMLKEYPHFTTLRSSLGMLLIENAIKSLRYEPEQYSKALTEAQEYLTGSHHTLLANEYRSLMAVLSFMRRKYADALRFIEAALNENPENVDHVSMKGDILMQQGPYFRRQFVVAELCFTQVIAKAPEDASNYLKLALIYVEGGDGVPCQPDEAKRCLEIALGLDNESILEPIARTETLLLRYAKLGKLILDDPALKAAHGPQAKKLFKELLADAPQNPELKSLILSCAL